MSIECLPGKLIANQYIIGRQLGKGAFGEVYIGVDKTTSMEVAIKFEMQAPSKRSQLRNEAKIYKLLQGCEGIPIMYYSGVEGDYNILILQLLGANLEKLLSQCERTFSIKTMLLLANEMLKRIESVHKIAYIHRDIKPENFLIGKGTYANTVYIIDFGLAKRYINIKSKLHIPFKENKKLTGTARYCSINTHMGLEQSRRDDIEGLMYCLIYFFNGELPWMGLRAVDKKEKYEKIMEVKMTTTVEALCSELPSICIIR